MPSITIAIPAAQYADYDDCLAAAAAAYVADHPAAAGWDLSPRWADEQRDVILIDVQMTHVVEGCVRGQWTREAVEAGGDALFTSEAEAQAAIDSLVAVGFDRDQLRVRAL